MSVSTFQIWISSQCLTECCRIRKRDVPSNAKQRLAYRPAMEATPVYKLS